MKKGFLLLLGVILLSSLALGFAYADPKIEIDKLTNDIGRVNAGPQVTVSFNVKNAGDADLDILDVKAHCTCTSVKASKTKLAPGETGTVDIVIDTLTISGKFEKGIFVVSNDPAAGMVNLKITGDVIPIAVAQPERVNFGTLKLGTTFTQTVRITPTDPKTFKILKVESSSKNITVNSCALMKDDPAKRWEINLTVNASKPGRVFENIKAYTNIEKKEYITFQVFGNIVEQS